MGTSKGVFYMNTYLNGNINRVKKALTSLIMVGILATGGSEMIFPQTGEANFLVENFNQIGETTTGQENTILQANPTAPVATTKRIKMAITAYSSTVGQTDSTPFITASNSTVRDGIVANNLLPFGTRIRVPELYGDKVFVVEDRMNKKKGNYHLDIWFASTHEAQHFGSTVTYIEVLED